MIPSQRNKYVGKTTDGEALGNPKRNYKKYNEDPTTYKVDRERAAPKRDRDMIFDTQEFKKAVEDAIKNFGPPKNPPTPRKKVK